MMVRLNKFLAECGIASRRKADQLIEQGLVTVNGRRVFELGIQVDPRQDKITVEGRLVKPETTKVYLAFYKPRQVLTTMADPENRPCIADYVSKLKVRVFPVGRLDWDSEGLLLLTNDGEWAQQILHPSGEVTKTYLVKVDGSPSDRDFEKLKRGVSIIGGKVRALAVSYDRVGTSAKNRWIRIVIAEGKKHQVRQMFHKIGFDVLRLKRVAIGRLRLGAMRPGELRQLTPKQRAQVFQPDVLSERYQRSVARTKV